VAFFLTTPILGIMYYFLPKAASARSTPTASRGALLVPGVHLHLGGAAPPALHGAARLGANPGHGLQHHALGALLGGMLNGLLTLRGAWDKLRTDP